MEYQDYKDEWEEFFTTQMRFAVNSVSIDMARVCFDSPAEVAEIIVSHLIDNFAHQNSFSRYHRYMVLLEWANEFVRKDLMDKSIELIVKTRKDDNNEKAAY